MLGPVEKSGENQLSTSTLRFAKDHSRRWVNTFLSRVGRGLDSTVNQYFKQKSVQHSWCCFFSIIIYELSYLIFNYDEIRSRICNNKLHSACDTQYANIMQAGTSAMQSKSIFGSETKTNYVNIHATAWCTVGEHLIIDIVEPSSMIIDAKAYKHSLNVLNVLVRLNCGRTCLMPMGCVISILSLASSLIWVPARPLHGFKLLAVLPRWTYFGALRLSSSFVNNSSRVNTILARQSRKNRRPCQALVLLF